MKKFLFLSASLLLIFSQGFVAETLASAAVNFDVNTTISGVTFGGTTTTLTILASSTADSITINDSGIFTVTNPGSIFYVSAASSTVKSIKSIGSTSGLYTCTANTTPGTSYAPISSTPDTYTITPLSVILDTQATAYNSSCGATTCQAGYQVSGSGASATCSTCASITGATAYNSNCGAANCSSGYNITGSGASATCSVASSGGSTGGSSGPAPDPNNSTKTTQTYVTTNDGTTVTSDTQITRVQGITTQTSRNAIIDLPTTPTQDQSVTLDTFMTSEVKEIKLDLSKEVLQDIVTTYGDSKNLEVKVISESATDVQKTNTARGGMFLIGFDIFTFDLSVGTEKIKTFSKPINLNFDVSKISHPEELKIYYFDESSSSWKIAGDGGALNGGMLSVSVNHLTDFALMKPISTVTKEEIKSSRPLAWQQILEDATVVQNSGTKLDEFITYNQTTKDVAAQKNGMEKYTNKITSKTDLATNEIYAINNFIVYGTKSTQILGAGERAGVVNSYKSAFGALPKTEADWTDCLAIANGRWPAKSSLAAIDQAKKEFKKIYKRAPNTNQPNDNAAVTIMAYGLRNAVRNTNSENASIKTFKALYKKAPLSASEWDIVRAIAYSGAKR